jgi:hypothetical protein
MALIDMIRGRQVIEFMTNKSGGSVAAGDVVIIDTGNDTAFTTTTSAQSLSVFGVVQESIANNASGRVCVSGYVPLVNVNASVTRGHFAETHTVAKQATGSSARRSGSFGRFLTGGATPTAHLFGLVDSISSGNAMATDVLWDAAGDLAVGSGADTAAKLTKGAAGGSLSIINAAVAWNSGTSNPGSAVAGDRYWRTDLGQEIYYDGTRWLTTTLYHMVLGRNLVNLSASGEVSYGAAVAGAHDMWLVSAYFDSVVATTNNGTNNWTLDLERSNVTGGDTVIATRSTSGDTADVKKQAVVAIGALAGTDTVWFYTFGTKVLSPGILRLAVIMTYRLVVT